MKSVFELPYDITENELKTVKYCYYAPSERTVRDIQNHLGLSSYELGLLIESLQENGLIIIDNFYVQGEVSLTHRGAFYANTK